MAEFNTGAGLTGLLGGAGTGAQFGASFGPASPYTIPISSIIGALIGLFGGGYGTGQGTEDFLSGTPGGIEEANRFNPQQQDALSQLLGMGMNQYANPYEGFEPIRKDILNTFKGDVLPYIQNQFNRTGGHFSSGILGQNVARANTSLADRLASAQAQYGQQSRQNATGLINTGLTPLTTQYQKPGQPGLLSQLAPTLAKAGIGAATGYLGTPEGGNTRENVMNGIYKLLQTRG